MTAARGASIATASAMSLASATSGTDEEQERGRRDPPGE